MRKIWKYLQQSDLRKGTKNRVFIAFVTMSMSMIGAAAWLLIGRLFLPQMEWLLCFIGYSGVYAGLFGSILYLYNHEF